jgi:hypothetical protein
LKKTLAKVQVCARDNLPESGLLIHKEFLKRRRKENLVYKMRIHSVAKSDLEPKEEAKEDKWHTQKWYKENFGVDPSKLNLPFVEEENPHYSEAPSMKLWKESDVLPFKSEEGIKKYQKRREAGLKASETRKKHLKEWFIEIKRDNPRVKEILERLWEIGERISELHDLKEECRESDPTYSPETYWKLGIEHCKNCERMSGEQAKLREERSELFTELEKICKKDKKTIQLARRYLRKDRF